MVALKMASSTKMCAGLRPLHILVLFLTVLCVCSPVEGRSPFLKLENNGYKNVVVALDPDITKETAVEMVEAIKNLFTHVSWALYTATQSHVYLSDVTILLPEHLRNLPDGFVDNPASYETYEGADVKVELSASGGADDYDHDPSTVRAGGCGEPGEYIRLTTDFVKKAVPENLAKAVVREWAQFRYGVFDECGTPGDPVHPAFYITSRGNNTVAPTNCVNVDRLAGQIVSCPAGDTGSEVDSKCDFKPNIPATVQSSLMYMPYLPEVVKFCDGDTHNKLAPTKHNILCREESVWGVIQKSPDFRNLNTVELDEEHQKPTFRVLKAVNSSYVVVLDTSNSMKDKFQAVRASVMSFLGHVPEDTPVGLVQFASRAAILQPFSDVKSKDKFKKSLPKSPSSDSLANGALALDLATTVTWHENVLDQRQVRQVIVMITAGRWNRPFTPDVNELCNSMVTKKAHLEILLLQMPDDQDVFTALQKLTACTGGSLRLIQGDSSSARTNHVTLLREMNSGLLEALAVNLESEQIVQIHSSQVFPSDPEAGGSFYVDRSIGAKTKLQVFYTMTTDFENVKVIAPDGHEYGTDDDYYQQVPEANSEGLTFPVLQPGKWSYQIQRPEGGQEPLTVVVTSQARDKEPIRVRCWTNMAYEDIVAGNTPLIIYAEVKQGPYQVAGAIVEAVVDVPDDVVIATEVDSPPRVEPVELPDSLDEFVIPESSDNEPPQALASTAHQPTITTTLKDDGSGVPDITSGDGIYSSYFTNMPRTGVYTVRVRVQGTPNTRLQTEKRALDASNYYGCRRKSVEPKGYTGEFERLATCSSLNIVGKSATKDPYPPARITDLQVAKKDLQTGQVTVTWTAVGDDYHDGIVDRYDIRIDTNRSHFNGDDVSKATSVDLSMPIQQPRTKQATNIKIPNRNKLYYIAVRGYDGENNVGPTSNIIGVVMPEAPPTAPPSPLPILTSTPMKDDNDTVSKDKTQTASVGAGAIVGIVIAAVLIVVIVAIVFIVTTKRRREEERKRKAKHQRYSSVPKDEKEADDDHGGFVPDNSRGEGGQRGSQSKGIASSNTSV